MRLSPLDPFHYNMVAGTAFGHMFAGRYDDAASWAERALRDLPNFVPPIRIAAASHALAGRIAEAQKFMARVRELDPTLRLSNLGDSIRFADQKTLPDGRMVFERLVYRGEGDRGIR